MWPGALALDDRPGGEWTADTVAALVDLLANVTALAGDASVLVVDEVAPDIRS